MNCVDNLIKVFSVREAIEFCIENKLKGATEQLKSFDKSGKLGANQKKKLQANLECLANIVIISGGGKKGQVILRGLKGIPTERITGNSGNGRQFSDEDKIMKEYLFKVLCSDSTSFDLPRRYTVKQLIKLNNLMPISNKGAADIEKVMMTILSKFYEKKQIVYIKSNATHNVVSRQRADINLYIKHLVKENRIRVEDIHMVKYLETSFSKSSQKKVHGNISLFQDIDEIEYNKIKGKITEIAESNGLNYKDYVQAANKIIKIDSKVRKMLNEVEKYYIDNNFDYLFLTKNITILQPESVHSVTREEARKAFESKIIKLTNNRMKKVQYHNRTHYIKEFYRLAMFVMLQKLGVEGLEKIIEEEILMIPHKVDEMHKKYHGRKPTFAEIIDEYKDDLYIVDMIPTGIFDLAIQQKSKIEGKHWKANNSLALGNYFNIKPDNFMISLENFGEFERHSREELEMMRVEQLLENRQL